MRKEAKLFITGGILMYIPYWPFPVAGFILWGVAVVLVWWPRR